MIIFDLFEDNNEKSQGPLTVDQLATISDAALDAAYGYGRSSPGNTFGWQANLKSASFAKQMIDKGITDVEAISDAIHKGWNVTAQAFVKNPMQFDDSKTMAPEKLQAKIAQRQKLMTQQYAQLPEDEKEKDRVVARAMLQAITGQQGVAEKNAKAAKNNLNELAPTGGGGGGIVAKGPASRGGGDDNNEYLFELVKNGSEVLSMEMGDLDDNPSGTTLEQLFYEYLNNLAKPQTGGEGNGVFRRHFLGIKPKKTRYQPEHNPGDTYQFNGEYQENPIDVYPWLENWLSTRKQGVAETAPLSTPTRRQLVAPTDRDLIRRELWKYVRSLDQEGMSNRAHAMAYSCPTWGRLYRQFNNDVSQLLSTAPTELLAQALQEIQSKFQVVAEAFTPGQNSPYDCGGADSEYGRRYNPHKVVDHDQVPLTDPQERAEYRRGWEEQESMGGAKNKFREGFAGARSTKTSLPHWIRPHQPVEYGGRVYTIQKVEGGMVQIGDVTKNRFRVPFHTLHLVGQSPKLYDEDSNVAVEDADDELDITENYLRQLKLAGYEIL